MQRAVVSKAFQSIYDNINKSVCYLNIKNCDFGIGYNQAILNINLSPENKICIETRAFHFIKELLQEIKKRLPDNLEFFKKLKLFSPAQCLNQINTPFSDLPFINIFLNQTDFILVGTQWDKLVTVTWKIYLNEKELHDSHQFWPKVYNYQDAGGNYAFRELAGFVLKILSLPSSNAVVERVFSIMNTVKTKARNRINTKMLDALLRIKCTFISTNKCCTTFSPSKLMYDKFNSEIMYKCVNNVNTVNNVINEELLPMN